ncbi:MAG: amino acid permease, partial [Acidobacteriota bacterium]
QLETAGKVLLFLVLIAAGLWAVPSREPQTLVDQLTPFYAFGALGLVQAMGYTFIALQGFDLIAAVGGEVKDPARNLPRAMVASLGVALLVYLPLLLIVATVGVDPKTPIAELAAAEPEAVVALAVEHYLGRTGFWLVILAALLSMLSALQANLMAASHIALAMARDRNLPSVLGRRGARRGTPSGAVLVTAGMVAVILLVIPNVATAGAMSSLIFLLSFTLAHWMSILARRRGGGRKDAFLLPLFPLIPALGGLACLSLAIFQGIAVPAAGAVAAVWLAVGGALYALFFSSRARVADAAAEALDPQLVRLRGRTPLVLVPIANPRSAESLVTLATALAPPHVGRVLLLYVVETPETWTAGDQPPQLLYAQQVLGEALTASFAAHRSPEALTTVSPEPWREIGRVARAYSCESLLLGLGDLEAGETGSALTATMDEVAAESDVVLLKAPEGWHLSKVRRVLVPVGGRRDQSSLRARLLGSLSRSYRSLEVTYMAVVDPAAAVRGLGDLERDVREMAEDEAPGSSRVDLVYRTDVAEALVEAAQDAQLVILGLRREGGAETFGEIPRRVARETGSAVLMIGQRSG